VHGIAHGWQTGWNAVGAGGPLDGFDGVVAQAVMANSEARSNALMNTLLVR
jgi:hypothetical protein